MLNSGGTYREVTCGLGYATRSKSVGKVVFVTTDTEKIRRHEAKFVQKDKKRQRRTTPNVKALGIELDSRGVVPAAIADALNVSDRRVAAILRAA